MGKREDIAKQMSLLVPVMIRNMYPFVFQPLDLPPSQVLVLSVLFEKGRCRIGQLSRYMHNSPPTTSGIIDRLEKSGYIKRIKDVKDRRATSVVLTQRGRKVVEQFQLNIKQRWQFILSKLTESEGDEILRVIQRIVKGLGDGTTT